MACILKPHKKTNDTPIPLTDAADVAATTGADSKQQHQIYVVLTASHQVHEPLHILTNVQLHHDWKLNHASLSTPGQHVDTHLQMGQ